MPKPHPKEFRDDVVAVARGERLRSGTGGTATTFGISPVSPAPAWSKTGTTSTWTVRDPEGTLISVRIGASSTSATEYYPFTDNVASVRAMVKADGTLSNTYAYSACGTTLSLSEASGASQPYRYGGGYTDTATGLIKLGIRYYDPTGQDPHYVYAKGCPTTYNDPTGAKFVGWDCALSVLGTVGGAALTVLSAATTPVTTAVGAVAAGGSAVLTATSYISVTRSC